MGFRKTSNKDNNFVRRQIIQWAFEYHKVKISEDAVMLRSMMHAIHLFFLMDLFIFFRPIILAVMQDKSIHQSSFVGVHVF
jgi:hypothetical protein